MTYKEFKSVNERSIVRKNHSFDFTKLPDDQWLISVHLMGMDRAGELEGVHHWEAATTIVTDIQANCIWNNLLEEEGES